MLRSESPELEAARAREKMVYYLLPLDRTIVQYAKYLVSRSHQDGPYRWHLIFPRYHHHNRNLLPVFLQVTRLQHLPEALNNQSRKNFSHRPYALLLCQSEKFLVTYINSIVPT